MLTKLDLNKIFEQVASQASRQQSLEIIDFIWNTLSDEVWWTLCVHVKLILEEKLHSCILEILREATYGYT